MPHSESADSSQYAVLTPEERRSGLKSGIGKAHKDFMRMIDWAEEPNAVDKDNKTQLQGRENSDEDAQTV